MRNLVTVQRSPVRSTVYGIVDSTRLSESLPSFQTRVTARSKTSSTHLVADVADVLVQKSDKGLSPGVTTVLINLAEL